MEGALVVAGSPAPSERPWVMKSPRYVIGRQCTSRCVGVGSTIPRRPLRRGFGPFVASVHRDKSLVVGSSPPHSDGKRSRAAPAHALRIPSALRSAVVLLAAAFITLSAAFIPFYSRRSAGGYRPPH